MPTRVAIDMPSPALESAQRLRRLAAELEGGGEDSKWLANRLWRYVSEASRGLSIQEALDLDPALNGETWFQEERRDQRDTVLREMAQRFWPSRRPAGQAREIERRSLRYGGAAWGFDCDRHDMPENYRDGEFEFLWRAFKSGAAMPIKRRQLETILTAENTDRAA